MKRKKPSELAKLSRMTFAIFVVVAMLCATKVHAVTKCNHGSAIWCSVAAGMGG